MKTNEQKAQKDFIKTHRRTLWTPFIKAIKTYHLIEENDKIAVALSGGKDSLIMALMLKELTHHPLVNFEIKLLAMDPGYHPFKRAQMEENFKTLNLDVEIIDKPLFEVIEQEAPDYPCYLCARIRRGILYGLAEKHGCNKLALGHHFNDVIETTLLNMFYAGAFKTMKPKLNADHFKGMSLIRPMTLIKEQDIERFMKRQNLHALDCACAVSAGQTASKRQEIKTLIATLKEKNPDIDKAIFNAGRNVNLDHVFGWVKDGKTYTFED